MKGRDISPSVHTHVISTQCGKKCFILPKNSRLKYHLKQPNFGGFNFQPFISEWSPVILLETTTSPNVWHRQRNHTTSHRHGKQIIKLMTWTCMRKWCVVHDRADRKSRFFFLSFFVTHLNYILLCDSFRYCKLINYLQYIYKYTQ